jgi:hypothetical protein
MSLTNLTDIFLVSLIIHRDIFLTSLTLNINIFLTSLTIRMDIFPKQNYAIFSHKFR